MDPNSPTSARECAPFVRTSPAVLYRMARAGLVPCLRTGVTGRGVRFIPAEVREALAARPVWKQAGRG